MTMENMKNGGRIHMDKVKFVGPEEDMKEKEQKDMKEQMNKINRETLYFGKVPEDVKTRFKELAKTDFDNHYGLCLKWLMDFREGILTSPNEMVKQEVSILSEEVCRLNHEVDYILKQMKDKVSESQSKLLVADNGKVIRK